MNLIADILMAAGAFGAALYCSVLSTRLKRFSTLESGMGGAIAVLSAQVDDMTTLLESARTTATGSASRLDALTVRAEGVSARLELLVAAMHDLPGNTAADAEHDAEQPSISADRRMRVVRRRLDRAGLEAAE